ERDSESDRLFEEYLYSRSGTGFWRRAWKGDDDRERVRRSRGASGGVKEEEDQRPGADKPSQEDLIQTRLKERYRLLVRSLHPDLTREKKDLWNQVQQAYREKNLDQLDLLVAMADVFSGKISRFTGLSQLRGAAQEIERLLVPLRRKLEAMRQDRAWKFSEL